MATFAISLNKSEISWDQNTQDTPLYFENDDKLIVFMKKHRLWYVAICLDKKYNAAYLYKLLELMDVKVGSEDDKPADSGFRKAVGT